MSVDELYRAIAAARDVTVVDALFERLPQQPKEARSLVQTLWQISGYDQPLLDDDDHDGRVPDRQWLQQQHPRHDDLLVRLFRCLVQPELQRWLADLNIWAGLRWMSDGGADAALQAALPLLAEAQLPMLLQTLAYRLRYRRGPATALQQALALKPPALQFLAAEGLALAGHQYGSAVLLAAMDYQTDGDYRRRAVLALGACAEPLALDKLLKLAEDSGHFLQDVAIEALGHLGQVDTGRNILTLLQQQLRAAPPFSERLRRALNGLRWYNSLEAWQTLAAFIRDERAMSEDRSHAVTLLKHWSDSSARDLLLHLLRHDTQQDVVAAALDTARQIWPAEPGGVTPADYALVEGYYPLLDEERPLQRLAEHGPVAELLRLLGADLHSRWFEYFYQRVIETLQHSLLRHADYPTPALLAALDAEQPQVMAAAAHLLARIELLPEVLAQRLPALLARCYQQWQETWRRRGAAAEEKLALLQQALLAVAWATAVHRPDEPQLLHIMQVADKAHFELQRHILRAWQSRRLPLSAARNAVLHGLRQTAAGELHALVAALLPLDGEESLSQHPSQRIARRSVAELAALAGDAGQTESRRLGAIESLGRMADPAADQVLKTLSTPQTGDEDLQKAAYRALRRSLRVQQARAAMTTGAAA